MIHSPSFRSRIALCPSHSFGLFAALPLRTVSFLGDLSWEVYCLLGHRALAVIVIYLLAGIGKRWGEGVCMLVFSTSSNLTAIHCSYSRVIPLPDSLRNHRQG